jgi:hypothetical protein
MRKNVKTRFMEKVEKTSSCWEWTAGKDPYGYGRFYDGKHVGAHRVAWELFKGPIPQGLCVLHHCDNPSCVNPDHLFLGTRVDNARDRDRKNRTSRGERNGKAKLTKKQVLEIRARIASGETRRSVAKDFNICRQTIDNIANKKVWGHV